MRATDLVRAIVAPVVELTLLLPLLLFWATIGFATLAITRLGPGAFIGGILILCLVVPPLFRFQTHIAESYANGRAPDAFDAEYFNWIGRMWTLLPLLLAALLSIAGYYGTTAWGTTGTWLVFVLAAAIVPASLAVLVITHSALQALNPVALFRVFERAGSSFLAAPFYALVLMLAFIELAPLPPWAAIFVFLFALFSLASLTGTLIADSRLVDDVDIPDAIEPDEATIAGGIEKARDSALAHAYGFISRDNREGGFKHIIAEIEQDPDPAAAWAWYFARMLEWENKAPALFFAQHHIHDALRHGEDARALKVIMRCRLVDEQFKPRPEDIPAALAAAERTKNHELVEVLQRG